MPTSSSDQVAKVRRRWKEGGGQNQKPWRKVLSRMLRAPRGWKPLNHPPCVGVRVGGEGEEGDLSWWRSLITKEWPRQTLSLWIMQGFSFHLPYPVLAISFWMVRLIWVQVQPTLKVQELQKGRSGMRQYHWQPLQKSAYHTHHYHLARLRTRMSNRKEEKGNQPIELMSYCGCQLQMHSRIIWRAS